MRDPLFRMGKLSFDCNVFILLDLRFGLCLRHIDFQNALVESGLNILLFDIIADIEAPGAGSLESFSSDVGTILALLVIACGRG